MDLHVPARCDFAELVSLVLVALRAQGGTAHNACEQVNLVGAEAPTRNPRAQHEGPLEAVVVDADKAKPRVADAAPASGGGPPSEGDPHDGLLDLLGGLLGVEKRLVGLKHRARTPSYHL